MTSIQSPGCEVCMFKHPPPPLPFPPMTRHHALPPMPRPSPWLHMHHLSQLSPNIPTFGTRSVAYNHLFILFGHMFPLGEEPLHVVIFFWCFFCSFSCFVHTRMMKNNGVTVITTAAASYMTPTHISSQAIILSITKTKQKSDFRSCFTVYYECNTIFHYANRLIRRWRTWKTKQRRSPPLPLT